jgi:hypothetical protein
VTATEHLHPELSDYVILFWSYNADFLSQKEPFIPAPQKRKSLEKLHTISLLFQVLCG